MCNIYEKYLNLLNKHNLTNYQVHKQTGISTRTLSLFEKNKSTNLKVLAQIADMFEVSLSYFTDEKISIDVGEGEYLLLNFSKLNPVQQDCIKNTIKLFLQNNN